MSIPNPTPQPSWTGPKRLTRSRDDRMISGVCGGLARYLNVDATLIRVLVVVAFVFSGFFPVGVLYLIAWALMHEA
jgi:phage shock protein C